MLQTLKDHFQDVSALWREEIPQQDIQRVAASYGVNQTACDTAAKKDVEDIAHCNSTRKIALSAACLLALGGGVAVATGFTALAGGAIAGSAYALSNAMEERRKAERIASSINNPLSRN